MSGDSKEALIRWAISLSTFSNAVVKILYEAEGLLNFDISLYLNLLVIHIFM